LKLAKDKPNYTALNAIKDKYIGRSPIKRL